MSLTQNGVLQRDDNDYAVMGGTSSVDNNTIINSAFDPDTRRILADLSGGGGSGTVTSVSVVTANGFAGTVATATTTPAITLTTSVTGLVYGNGTSIAAVFTNPAANVLVGWDNTDGAYKPITIGSGLTYTHSTHTLSASGGGGGTVDSVVGTSNRITVDSTDPANPIVDISASYVGQSSITTLGTIGTGTWQGSVISSTYGGTGVNNGGRTLTVSTNNGTLSFTSAVTLTVANTASISGTNTGDQTTVSGNAGTATALQNARTIGGVSFDGTANITVASATAGFTVSGGALALGANNLTMTGSLAATGARVTKGWFTDVESTNMPTVGGTAILTSLTAPQFTTIELGNASDTTLARVSAGVISVEGVRVITSGGTTSGTILKNNGTTFVASTETYAAPGTSGNVMTSDGTNWTSAAPSAVASTTNGTFTKVNTSTTTTTITHGLGRTPVGISLSWSSGNQVNGNGNYGAGGQSSINVPNSTTTTQIDGSHAVSLDDGNGSLNGTVSSVGSTTFAITWATTGSPSGDTFGITWNAI